MSPLILIALTFLGIVFLLLLGVPVAFSFAIGTLILLFSSDIDPGFIISSGFKMLQSFVFLCFPLYIALGIIVGRSGIADRLSDWFISVIGRVRGGLGISLILTNAVFGAMSGSAAAALAGISKAFMPSMEKEGYPRNYTVSLLIPSAVLSLLIPPSSLMILYGFLTSLPISLCFLAPVIPGLILAAALCTTHLVLCRRITTIHVAPKIPAREQFRKLVNTTYHSSLSLILPIIILGSIYLGFATPTESAAMGVFYVFFVGLLFYRTIHIKDTFKVLSETAKITGSLVILMFFFTTLSKLLILRNASEILLDMMMSISTDRYVIMVMLNVLMLLLGMFMDDGSAMMVAAIFLEPVAVAVGYDPFHFAAIACLNLGFGLITPPVAMLLYMGGRVADLPLRTYIRTTLIISVVSFVPTLLITIYIPELSTALPRLFLK